MRDASSFVFAVTACLSMLLIGLALAFVIFWIIGFEITAADFAGYRRHFVVI
ncbi:hypothetical protein SeSB_A0792 [Salmonella enterica subsp. enterica serovar Schwarzengrund str. SL480]|uniref:Uncharacterized protein n=1 Tax=Salmonella schwarzengrund (strain CVM19633) TaxID=439843 RepID=A0A0N1QSR4_SALSV|nr:hypothetical protein SeSA_A0605 [Salmonella enterica subsp. enterica serovar Schwarzengrund str. CVM19633]EDY27588.1 hypothetical protein SeSB_A0792 [Salmonella enterica subsp. enterica serovar Schwarzengrund str. SL480]